MEFTIKTDELKRALVQVGIHGDNKLNNSDKLRIEIMEDYCFLITSNGEITIRTKLDIYESNVPVGTTLIVKEFSRLTRTTMHLLWLLTTVRFEIGKDIVEFVSGEKKFLLYQDALDTEYANFPAMQDKSVPLMYETDALLRRYKKIKYALNKSNVDLNKIFFSGEYMYATDSICIALSKNMEFVPKFDFTLKPYILELICNTLSRFIDIVENPNFLFFYDNKGNSIAVFRTKDKNLDFKKLLGKQYKMEVTVNAELFVKSLEFLKSYYLHHRADKLVVAWRNSQLRIVGTENEIETKIPISSDFNCTLSFDLKYLLICLKQFKSNDVVIKMNSSVQPISICLYDNECLLMPVKTKNDPFEREGD